MYDKINTNMKNLLKQNKNKKDIQVFAALSGGVDSALAAYLLKKQGYQVTGVFMKNWSGKDFGIQDECPWKKDQKDAQAVCTKLDIPFKTYNFEKEYRQDVVEYFFEEYRAGRTPNPDIMCNQKIKFGRFLDRALSQGADMIATGHYANKSQDNYLMRAKDQNKDQTYFLYRLTKDQIAHSLFPLGNFTKPQVRQIAAKQDLPTAAKKDSQGICFIGKIDVEEFLQTQIDPQKGDIIDIDTQKKVGEHNGVYFYTHGQRQGLAIGGASKPYFVADKDIEKNILFAAMGKDNPALYQQKFSLKDLHWTDKKPEEFGDDNKFQGMVRYRQTPQDCRYIGDGKVLFDKPVWKPAPGQSLILIRDEKILGGGIIK
jgi:tRNA-specific 2-thiouridylase